jgi:hypothetical protein
VGGSALLSLKRYDPGICCSLGRYMALAGKTLSEIAAEFGVTDRSVDNWVKQHVEFREAVNKGRDLFDTLIEGSLAKRAFGYDVEEVTREYVQVGVKLDGTAKMRMRVTKRVTRHIAGDVSAQQTWLNNRKPLDWRNTSRIDVRHSGKIGTRPDYSRLSDAELVTMQALAAKAEANASGN